MEMNRRFRNWRHKLCLGCLVVLLLVVTGIQLSAQTPVKRYTVKQGKMYIELSKQLKETELDRFIGQYDLYLLGLKQLIKNNQQDSLKKAGWKVELNNTELCIISKPLNALEDINNPADRINVTDKQWHARSAFPIISNRTIYGYNRFRNKSPFAINDSIVSFFFRGNLNATRVVLAGTFNDWKPDALKMKRVDSGWVVNVKLSPGKYWYKFVVDGNWTIDNDNRANENDGKGNTNSVFYYPNTTFKLKNFSNAKRVYLAGSFNNWQTGQLMMSKNSSNEWELPIYLAEGTHTYRFIVDGNWYSDPSNPDKFPNEFNDFNSVIRIGKTYLFSLKGYQEAKKVMLMGAFNNWRDYELAMNKTKEGWELPYTLGPGNYDYKFIADGKVVSRGANQSVSAINGIVSGSSLVISPNYTFRLKGFDNAKSVFLAGDFNNWEPNSLSMRREQNEWVFTVHLSAGKHLYKFIVDGKWIIDPANKLWEQNEYNTANSVIWIEK